ncbi:Serine/threonine-protein kinase ATM [Dendrobium catenatum]|uniref:Serine/threonine-protein kinase ATM n=1 Tax=Dendrobium catenatum TaxID=906689 RepID=A0A2I0WZ02_9ASPA|nr:Serine/threonine-protein kinase ATM [Dendrobium catenatum]
MEDSDQALLDAEVLDCSIETLSMLHKHNTVQVLVKSYPSIRIPRQIREPLLHEMEEYISGLMGSNKDFEKTVLGNLINICSLLCNFIHCSIFSRLKDEKGLYYNKLLNYTVKLIDHIAYLIDENFHEVQRGGSVSVGCMFDGSRSTFMSLQSFISGPLFRLFKDEKHIDTELLQVIQSAEKILAVLGRSFTVFSNATVSLCSGLDAQALQLPGFQESNSAFDGTARIMDVDLDAENCSRDADSFNSPTSNSSTMFYNPMQRKLTLVSVISSFSSVSPKLAWETLFELLGKEDDAKVNSLHDNLEKNSCSKLSCESILTCIRMLLGTLQSRCSIIGNANLDWGTEDMAVEEVYSFVYDTL